MTNSSNTELSCSAQANIDVRGEEIGSGDDADDLSMVVIGITIGLVASVGINLGQNIQASNVKNANDDSETIVEKKKWWRRGTALFAVSAIANFVAFAFAPASVLAPLEGAQFVTNFFYGWLVKNQVLMKTFWWTSLGTLFVVAGITLPIVTTSGDVAVFDENAIWCFWSGDEWWFYVGLTSAFAIVSTFSLWAWSPKDKYNNRLHMVLFSVPAAVLGAFGVVQAKAISELVEPILTEGAWDVLTRCLFRQSVILIVIGLGGWLFLLNRAPGNYEPVTILPLMQGCYIMFSSIGGGIFFEEFDSFSDIQGVMFASGLFLMLVGLYFILPKVPEDKVKTPLTKIVEPDTKSVVLGGMFVPVMLYPKNERSESFSIVKTGVCANTNASYSKFPRMFVNV
jgi:hypothetical protein